jgi:hypothetical protein
LGITAAFPDYNAWIALVVLEITFFVNSAGLFFLSALIEKNKNAKKKYGEKGEITTVIMPPALVEATESYLLFALMIMFCEHQVMIYWIFSIGVIITIL